MKKTVSDLHVVVSNRCDCIRFGLAEANRTPWNWASNWVIDQALLSGKEDAIDLGCVNNPYILGAAARCKSLTLCDIQKPPTLDHLPRNAVFQQVDLNEKLPFDDGQFDVVFSESSLEHLPVVSRHRCAREARRILKPGGRLCITLGYPLGIDEIPDTKHQLIENPFFKDRFCSIHTPVSIYSFLHDGLNVEKAPYNIPRNFEEECLFESRLLADADIVRDDYAKIDAVPNIAGLKKISIVEIGISCHINAIAP